MARTSLGAEELVYDPHHMYEGISTDKFRPADPLAAWWPTPKGACVSLHLLPGCRFNWGRWFWRWYRVSRLPAAHVTQRQYGSPSPALLCCSQTRAKSLVAEIRSQIAESVVQHRAEACDHDPSPKTERETLTLPLALALALTLTPGCHVRLHLGGNSGNYRKGKRYV